MDTKSLTESDSITMKMVRDSPSKKLVILSAGAIQPDKEGKQRFQCLVEIDGMNKVFRPNKTTLRVLQAKYGMESSLWVGKSLILTTGVVEGKEAILGTPA